jgi:HD superfamily phosphohydrolase
VDGIPTICHNLDQKAAVSQVFSERFNMHKYFYTHDDVAAAECMVVDILVLAEPILQIKEKIRTVEGFILLKDSILDFVRVGKHDQKVTLIIPTCTTLQLCHDLYGSDADLQSQINTHVFTHGYSDEGKT